MQLLKCYQPCRDAFENVLNKDAMWHYSIYGKRVYRWGLEFDTNKIFKLGTSGFSYEEVIDEITYGNLYRANKEMKLCY